MVGQCEHLSTGCDVIGRAGKQIERAGDDAQGNDLAADDQRSLGQFVVLEEVLDDPQIEGAGESSQCA
jgi:hypothetical protein